MLCSNDKIMYLNVIQLLFVLYEASLKAMPVIISLEIWSYQDLLHQA